ncbi:hypothetical protein FFK22_025100 [Mycobacterium sp. KBS0706]|jgi:hypothetical protein|uniref:trypco2 family protein n=1 Tax=Mycobacterium sp. KBS0706 TaxID=2578109 RepID=UPI00110F71BC|nr:trypco2 family protein [Mycobacterium sp. KBS0706]TSD85878.1 hypothetical protein FFK22_025100 [Mycobacterium sp. KBS0706]
MRVTLAEAIKQLRDELREAVLEGKGQDIVFTPETIELELGITFDTEVKASGGFKLFAFLDLSAEATAGKSNQHRVKLTLKATDDKGEPLKVRSTRTGGLS